MPAARSRRSTPFSTSSRAVPNTIIAAGGYLTVWCDSATNDPGVHTLFSLAKNGGLLEMFAGTAELALAEVEHALGRPTEARAALAEAQRHVTAIADRLTDAAVRERFLANPHPNGEILALAKAWDAAG